LATIFDLPIKSISKMDDIELKQFIRTRRELRREFPPPKVRKVPKNKKKKVAIKTSDEAISLINSMDKDKMAEMIATLKARI